eukprot:TRINITY_DN51490_c0_g1_i1.p1 TRINITY_DN51490_c0_g1~~TRINITY_DN51490_c0_g1_i1.p1  ORF type:complete len:199 (+),score=48.45 TRINITY_DN51490_c0_g1_i1:114-710(+)
MSLSNSGSRTRLKEAGELSLASAFKPPTTPFTLLHYAAPDGGRRTTYEREVSNCEAVGEKGKRRAYLNADRLPKELLSKEAIETGTAKARAEMANAPAVLDPKIRGLMRQIAESEGTLTKVAMDPEFVQDIKRKHKVDHVTSIFTDPRLPQDDISTTTLHHQDMVSKAPRPDKKFFMKKNFYSEYVEAVVKQKGLGGK